MIIKQYIKDFENLGFGLFVHFGLYSLIEKGEWVQSVCEIPNEEYAPLYKQFNPVKDWADQLAATAKKAGCKYITLTTRHHEGYSLFDTCGLCNFDAPHGCGRDLVREFVDACRKYDIIPFFYHTLLDWYQETYKSDFNAYLKYLRDSVEILCKNYGKIGGLWFDGMWDRPDDDWQEDELYATIRKYQPEAMIINNTGLNDMGALGHIELDSVTFERGRPKAINLETSPKYIASEMCQVFGDHWGYAKNDLNFKSAATIIEDLAICRRYGSNFLLNVGPKPDGTLRLLDQAMLENIGKWMSFNKEAIHNPKPTDIEIENKPKDFVLKDGDTYYLFIHGLPMMANMNVTLASDYVFEENFKFDRTIKSLTWLDNGNDIPFEQNGEQVNIKTCPFEYGKSLVVRIAKMEAE